MLTFTSGALEECAKLVDSVQPCFEDFGGRNGTVTKSGATQYCSKPKIIKDVNSLFLGRSD